MSISFRLNNSPVAVATEQIRLARERVEDVYNDINYADYCVIMDCLAEAEAAIEMLRTEAEAT